MTVDAGLAGLPPCWRTLPAMTLRMLAFCALVFALGCAGDPLPLRDCTPGVTLACACVGGGAGAQLCSASGTLGACVCPDAGWPTDVIERDAAVVDAAADVADGGADATTADAGAVTDATTVDGRVDAADASADVADTGPVTYSIDSGVPGLFATFAGQCSVCPTRPSARFSSVRSGWLCTMSSDGYMSIRADVCEPSALDNCTHIALGVQIATGEVAVAQVTVFGVTFQSMVQVESHAEDARSVSAHLLIRGANNGGAITGYPGGTTTPAWGDVWSIRCPR